jgi:hypothetical protein
VIRLAPWPLALALLALFLIHERQAPPPDASARPRIQAASVPAALLPEPSVASGGSLEPAPDRSLPTVALSDDRANDESGHPSQDKDWKGLLHFGLSGARAGFDRMVRLPLSPAQAKWLYRAWGQP